MREERESGRSQGRSNPVARRTRRSTTKTMRLFSFPDPVNETSARVVAGGVLIMSVTAIVFRQHWLVYVLAYGFIARVLTGPTLSPLGLAATRIITPRLGVHHNYVPGPPKRFAQAIGATLSLAAVLALVVWQEPIAAYFFVGLIAVAATLESVFALCLGCKLFALLMRVGVIPESVCERCNNLQLGAQSSHS
jgi:hypothetical protein